ncbi:hypothetical protein SAMN02799630_01730 [Paenibacillus sp. UNCCL117]|uniref:hypothetical protein n=1 Tax=unclassified Paenibacillus TaxID=185978 RepID=UPI00088F88E5|nr:MULTISPECIES: hypothetical protein [unclassified Paenibacillus]SDC92167.1 hypothetical protein SAMN04488602_104217 [Paenibacillus sp. cl123]SFW29274.1 hypothetical protein SAMN02799630_01730 [Paenibacillus sp. UNCCL117]
MSMMNMSCQRSRPPSIQLKDALTEERRKLEHWFAHHREKPVLAEAEQLLNERLLQIDSALTHIRMCRHAHTEANLTGTYSATHKEDGPDEQQQIDGRPEKADRSFA